MGAFKGTQEKWESTNDGEANFYGISAKGDWLMRIQQNGSLGIKEQEANIKLIAAAPEMLKALERINELIYAKGLELGSEDYFKVRNLCVFLNKKATE